MSFQSIVRELKEMRNSRRSLRPQNQLLPEVTEEETVCLKQQGMWEVLPPEILFDILKRVEASQASWPARGNVVACAAVCRSWRQIMKQVVKSPEISGLLTFPVSLKQPAPRDPPIQCFIRRERATSSYCLYYGLSPALQSKNDKLMLAAQKIRHAASTHFMISLAPEEFSRTSSTYVGKLKSNFVGTKFTMYDSQPPCDAPVASSSRSSHRFHAKKVSPRVPAGNYGIASILYELNVLRSRGPRKMLVTLHSIPVSCLLKGGASTTPISFLHSVDERFLDSSSKKGKEPLVDFSSISLNDPSSFVPMVGEPLVLKNKSPRWHEQLHCWCLNFKGRVTVASVKNFQLVAMVDPSYDLSQAEQEKVILQFGKIGKDIFTMDYRYPLSAFQAFAICLSSFDTKPACE